MSNQRDLQVNRVEHSVIQFPTTSAIARRLYERELERTANQAQPRIDRRIRDLHRELCSGARFPRR